MPNLPFQWDRTTLIDRVADWIVNINDYPETVSVVRSLDDTGLCWERYRDFLDSDEWSGWEEKSQLLYLRIRQLLFKDTGIAVLKSGAALSGNQARLVELLLGCRLGVNVTMTPGKQPGGRPERPLFQATMKKDPTAGGDYAGNALKGNAIGLHTDGSGTIDRRVEVLSMLYLRPARFGGQSVVANSLEAFQQLAADVKEVLQRSFPRQNPYKSVPPPKELLCLPIFKRVCNDSIETMEFSYHPQRVRNGVKLARTSSQKLESETVRHDPANIPDKLTDEEAHALQELDDTLRAVSFDIAIQANEILLLNNLVVTHDRRPFRDDPDAPRLMERFWAGQFRSGNGLHHVGRPQCDSCRR